MALRAARSNCSRRLPDKFLVAAPIEAVILGRVAPDSKPQFIVAYSFSIVVPQPALGWSSAHIVNFKLYARPRISNPRVTESRAPYLASRGTDDRPHEPAPRSHARANHAALRRRTRIRFCSGDGKRMLR